MNTAEIIDLYAYCVDHHNKIFNALNDGRFISERMRVKLTKRLKHCKLIIRKYAFLNKDVYTFTIPATASQSETIINYHLG